MAFPVLAIASEVKTRRVLEPLLRNWVGGRPASDRSGSPYSLDGRTLNFLGAWTFRPSRPGRGPQPGGTRRDRDRASPGLLASGEAPPHLAVREERAGPGGCRHADPRRGSRELLSALL